jgi:hypothetical protein
MGWLIWWLKRITRPWSAASILLIGMVALISIANSATKRFGRDTPDYGNYMGTYLHSNQIGYFMGTLLSTVYHYNRLHDQEGYSDKADLVMIASSSISAAISILLFLVSYHYSQKQIPASIV